MNRNIKVKCPYCETENTVNLQNDYGDMIVVTCDVMEGGCDRSFVVDASVSITAKTLRIDGEDIKENFWNTPPDES